MSDPAAATADANRAFGITISILVLVAKAHLWSKDSNYKSFTRSPQLQPDNGARWNGAQLMRARQCKEIYETE